MINIGIIGCGKIARVCHIPEYENNKNARLFGFYNRTVSTAEALAEKYGAKVYPTVDDMLSDPEIDAVSICTPHTLHAPLTVKALEAGKHVLCEKPMATSYEQCEKMVAAAKRSGKKLMICQTLRLAPAYLKATEIYRSGAIGELLTFSASLAHSGPENWSPGSSDSWFFDKNSANVGVIGDLGVHLIDYILFLTGQKAAGVFSKLETLEKRGADGSFIGVDDNAVSVLKLSGGAVGNINVSWTNHGAGESGVNLFGSKGVIKIYPQKLILEMPDKTTQVFDFEPTANTGVIDDFIESVNGEASSRLSGESVLEAMKTVFACVKSNQMKKWVEIPADKSEGA
ncbi:MAG: Gfo/Idh/MocA family oxidoreductase [Clostridia bacterium]|nr:Gfo/Idh/MocA family oxidoreductase [Clostridia bacterium]